MTTYKDANGHWQELVAVKDVHGNILQRVYRECSTDCANELEQQEQAQQRQQATQ